MHFTVLSLFKLFACSKSFNVLLLTNMEKKVQRVQTMIYTSAVVFVPYLDVEKRFLQHSIMAQHHHGPARLFLFKKPLACHIFWTVYFIHAKFTTATILLHTHHLVPGKKCITQKLCIWDECNKKILVEAKVFEQSIVFWPSASAAAALCREGRFQPVCAAVTNLCAINL